MKTIHTLSLFLFMFVIGNGQNLDSLKPVSINKTGIDKGLCLKEIGEIYKKSNELDSAIFYINASLEYLNSAEDRSDAIQTIGMVYFFKNDFLNALNNFKVSLNYANEIANDSIIARRYSDIGVVYDYLGAYDKSFEYYYKALKIFEKREDKFAMSKVFNNLAIITQNRGDVKKSLELYKKSLKLKKEAKVSDIKIVSSYLNIGSAYEQLKEYNKSLKFYNKSLGIIESSNSLAYLSLALSNIAGIHFFKDNMDSANYYNEKSFKINDSIENNLGLVRNYRLKGKILIKENKDSAIIYFYKALFLADTLNVLSDKVDILSDLVKVYKQNNNYNKAFFFQEELMIIKDTINSEKSNNKIETLKIVYETEKKEDKILLLQTKAQRNKVLIGIVAFIILLVGIIALLVFRQKLAQSKYKTDLFNQRLLRLQMNPHFIFNALASIQSYMFEKDTKKAAFYLSSFSKLTRAILNNSREELISLKDDIETTENYLKIQQMRFDNIFVFEIIVDKDIDSENVQVPPMLIQPFVENAVVHGFKNITYQGKIKVEYKKTNDNIEVIVEDNGRGIKSEEEKTHKSHALDITKERLKILNKKKKRTIRFKIVSLNTVSRNKGLKVIFTTPYLINK